MTFFRVWLARLARMVQVIGAGTLWIRCSDQERFLETLVDRFCFPLHSSLLRIKIQMSSCVALYSVVCRRRELQDIQKKRIASK